MVLALKLLEEWRKTFLEWGFTPLPARGYLKHTGLRLSEMRYEDIRALANEKFDDSVTGVWLYSGEPKREDGSLHIGVDIDAVGEADELWLKEWVKSTFSYQTARGVHLHFIVSFDGEPPALSRRMVIKRGDVHYGDVYVFAPPDDPRVGGGVNVGMLTYPSCAYDDKEPTLIVCRKLLTGKPPKRITWGEFNTFIRALFGSGVEIAPTSGSAKKKYAAAPAVIGGAVTQAVSEGIPPSVATTLTKYPCVDLFLRGGQKISPGARNNFLHSILSVLNRLNPATPEPEFHAFAQWVNQNVFTEPLPEGEVANVLHSVLGKRYTKRRVVFAAEWVDKGEDGVPNTCRECIHRHMCYIAEEAQKKEPELPPIPAEDDELDFSFPFRYYRGLQQKQLFREVVQSVEEGIPHVVGIAGTGVGKTAMVVGIMNYFAKRGTRVLVYAPQNKLQEQYLTYGEEGRRTVFLIDKGRRHFQCQLLYKYTGEQHTAEVAPCLVKGGVARFLQSRGVAVEEIKEDMTICESCEYSLHREAKERALTMKTPIVANPGLPFWLSKQESKCGKDNEWGVVVLDEAHVLIDYFVQDTQLRFVTKDDTDVDVRDLLSVLRAEAQRTTQELESLNEELRKLVGIQTYPYKEIKKIERKRARLQSHLWKMSTLINVAEKIENPHTALIVSEVDSHQYPMNKLAIYVSPTRQAEVLAAMFSIGYPHLRFVYLTATPDALVEGISKKEKGKIIHVQDVIPPENKPVFYIPLWNATVRRNKDMFEARFRTKVVPFIKECFNTIGTVAARLNNTKHVKAIVHESNGARARLLAQVLADQGYTVFLYDGLEEEPEGSNSKLKWFKKKGEAIDAFKEYVGEAFFIGVAITTGYDFVDDEVALQFIPKIPFPPPDDKKYEIAYRSKLAEGATAEEAETTKQEIYLRDVLSETVQFLGRINRTPQQFAATIILDTKLRDVLHDAYTNFPSLHHLVQQITDRLIAPESVKWNIYSQTPVRYINKVCE